MAFITPFKGWYFDRAKVNLEDVIVPPYDIITREERKEYGARSSYNIVHGILSGGEGNSRYANAKKFLDRLPQRYFRIFVGIFLALVGAKLLLWP